MVFRLIVAGLLALFAATSAHAEDRQPTFNFPQEKNAFHDAAAEIIRQAYAAIGVAVVFKSLSAERALQMSNRGRSDGELVRIEGIEAKYSNLIPIPVSHVTAEQMAFGHDPTLKIDGWQSLKPYRLVFHRGYKVAEQNTVGMDRHLTGNDVNAFTMVENKRMDIVIANRFSGEKIIADHGLKNVVMLLPPVQRDPLFHYIHSNHSDLVADVTGVMKSMKQHGDFARILNQFGVVSLGE